MSDVRCAVLVIDDDLGMRDTTQVILKSTCDVETADSAEAALEMLERKPYAVVLCDVRLPSMNGLDLLKIIKDRWPSTSVIMISVINDVSVAVEAMRRGAFFYMTKDFEMEALTEMVRLAALGPYDIRAKKLVQLRDENMTLRQENSTLKARLTAPTNIEDRRGANTPPKTRDVPAVNKSA